VTPSARTPAAQPPASVRRGSLGFAAGLFVAGVLIAGGVVALTSGGGTASKPPPPAKLPTLTQRFNDKSLGVTGLITRRWVVGGIGPILHLVSVDRKAVIAIGAPGAARTAHGALHAAIATIRKVYKQVTLNQALGSTLGGRPARSVVMYGTNPRGARLRILVATAEGRKLAYVMQVFTASNAPLRTLEEAQQIIATLRFNN
jgi:hypothetical protein